jgi:hypothetical protein
VQAERFQKLAPKRGGEGGAGGQPLLEAFLIYMALAPERRQIIRESDIYDENLEPTPECAQGRVKPTAPRPR